MKIKRRRWLHLGTRDWTCFAVPAGADELHGVGAPCFRVCWLPYQSKPFGRETYSCLLTDCGNCFSLLVILSEKVKICHFSDGRQM